MTLLIAKSGRLQKIFKMPQIRPEVKAASVICGLMRFDDLSPGYRGMRSMCFDRGYRKEEYYRNMIFKNIPEMAALPPIFLSTSDEDQLHRMTLDFARVLKANGVVYRLKYFKKGAERRLGHIFNVLHPDYGESAELISDMLSFFTGSAGGKSRFIPNE
jgi:hypothetical protein